MQKVGICGNIAINYSAKNGQTIKTRNLLNELQNELGENYIKLVDTYKWKSNPLNLLLNVLQLIKCKNVIVMPAQNGVKVLIPLLTILSKIFKFKIHYIVIGGWLPEYIEEHKWLKVFIKIFDDVFVETNLMLKKLNKQGFYNVNILPNFKRIQILDINDLNYNFTTPYKICTFSRVLKEKGIEDIINAVKLINEKNKIKLFELDIFGPIDDEYLESFSKLMENEPDYISYKGAVDSNNSVEVLKDYFMLVFPSYYSGEGFPGTIIDAFCAGIPVLSSDWKYNTEVVEDMKTGLIFRTKDVNQIAEKLELIRNNPKMIIEMKKNCIVKALDFRADKIIKQLLFKMGL